MLLAEVDQDTAERLERYLRRREEPKPEDVLRAFAESGELQRKVIPGPEVTPIAAYAALYRALDRERKQALKRGEEYPVDLYMPGGQIVLRRKPGSGGREEGAGAPSPEKELVAAGAVEGGPVSRRVRARRAR